MSIVNRYECHFFIVTDSINVAHSSLSSLNGNATGGGQKADGAIPPPAPPRSTSVRNLINNRVSGSSLDSSRDVSPTSTPRVGII